METWTLKGNNTIIEIPNLTTLPEWSNCELFEAFQDDVNVLFVTTGTNGMSSKPTSE